MKLIVQIPVLNEAETIGEVIDHIPRTIPGIDAVEVLIIDDGSTDATVQIALAHGVDHVVRHTSRRGLAAAYQTGIDACLRLGADLVVNTDGDHQYPGSAIPQLVAPILRGEADMVIGDRQTHTIEHFSPLKKTFQQLGSWAVRRVSNTRVPDAVSGFRALSREAALRTFVFTDFSYTVESLVQAGKGRLTVATVPIQTNPERRPSRLARGMWAFIKRQGSTLVRAYATYEPLKTFTYLALCFFIPGLLLLARAAYIYIGRNFGFAEGDNFQALVFGGVLVLLSAVAFMVGLLADLIGAVRRRLDEVLYRIRRLETEDQDIHYP